MRGRPPLPLGGHGKITVFPTGKPSINSRYRAEARFRGEDGKVVVVTKHGQTKAAASRALSEQLALLIKAGTAITQRATIADLAADFLAEGGSPRKWSRTSAELYVGVVTKHVVPRLGALTVRQATPAVCHAALTEIAKSAPSTARTARSCLNGIFGLAIRRNLITANPVKDMPAIGSGDKVKAPPRALSAADEERLTDVLRTDAEAVAGDLPDIVEFMLGTGVRIGEALAVRWDDVDFDARTVHIHGTVTRVSGDGLAITRPKTAAGDRTLHLPEHLLLMLRRRQSEARFQAPEGVIFPSPNRPTLRDRSNTHRLLRRALVRHGFPPEIKAHTFRKTVASKLFADPNLTPADVADQMGHVKLLDNVYVGRNKVANPKAADVLGRERAPRGDGEDVA